MKGSFNSCLSRGPAFVLPRLRLTMREKRVIFAV